MALIHLFLAPQLDSFGVHFGLLLGKACKKENTKKEHQLRKGER